MINHLVLCRSGVNHVKDQSHQAKLTKGKAKNLTKKIHIQSTTKTLASRPCGATALNSSSSSESTSFIGCDDVFADTFADTFSNTFLPFSTGVTAAAAPLSAGIGIPSIPSSAAATASLVTTSSSSLLISIESISCNDTNEHLMALSPHTTVVLSVLTYNTAVSK